MIIYNATSLAEIADEFERIAALQAETHRPIRSQKDRDIRMTREMIWREAAAILRKTTLEAKP